MNANEIAAIVILGLLVVLPVLTVASTTLWLLARSGGKRNQVELAAVQSRMIGATAELAEARGRAMTAESRLALVGDRFKGVFDLDDELASLRAQVTTSGRIGAASGRICRKEIHPRSFGFGTSDL